MSIDLYCFCSEPSEVVAEILIPLRDRRRDLFSANHPQDEPESLSDPTPWNMDRKSMALGFGILADSLFTISVNKENADQIQEIADAIYDGLGPGKVVVTFQTDHLIPHRGGKADEA